MNFSEMFSLKKLERKNFLYAAGLAALGGILLAKFPFRYITGKGNRAPESSRIEVRENPYSVKRKNA